MKKLFVHHPLFRLLSPLFTGALIYLLILLINNTIEDLSGNFFSQELYVCIGLAYVIQEAARCTIVLFNQLKRPNSFVLKSLLHVGTTLLITISLVISTMYFYFTQVLSYAPNSRELIIFVSIFSTVALFYVLLYISNHFLHKINTSRLEQEELARIEMEEDFATFKQDINPKLLLESLEAILVLMKKNPDEAETLTDDFASVYRYILTSKRSEVVGIDKELSELRNFIDVLNRLPFRNLKFKSHNPKNTLIVPGSLLLICETILRASIPSNTESVEVNLEEDETHLLVKYKYEKRLNNSLNINKLNPIIRSYNHYTTLPVEILHSKDVKMIKLPKLQLQ
ncbi:histidine kinase [Flagellimonas sp.]|uniref:histidine kinase n=1 Tax=Flagellimonas sp. TaxID=2058762 RepID=UPI003F49FE14